MSFGAWLLTYRIQAIVYVCMLLVCVMGIRSCLLPIWVVRRALIRANRKLSDRDENGAYRFYDPHFLQCKYVDDWWNRYIVNLREMRKSNGDCDVLSFINANTIIHSPSHTQFAEILPGILTSLGVLGTFLGLVNGVSGLQVEGVSVDVMQSSIARLIEGMQDAFYTSIVGVIGAVAFQLIRRMAISGANEALNRFVRDCQNVVSQPFTQDTKLIQTIYALLMEVRKSNEAIQKALEMRNIPERRP